MCQGYRKIPGVMRTQRPYWHGAWHVLRGRRDDMAIWARVTLNVLTPTLHTYVRRRGMRHRLPGLSRAHGVKFAPTTA